MDAKGRVSIPAAYRSELLRGSGQAPILTVGNGFLELYPFDDWKEKEDELIEASTFDVNVSELRRVKISRCDEGKIDSQGRLQVPTFLRDEAHLTRDIVLAGVGRYIELWDKARYEQRISTAKAKLPEIEQAVAEVEK